MKRVAIIGGGIAGLTCAWQLHQLGQTFTLYEATPRLGGTVRTIHRDGFILEQGPDGWVTEKPWAAELARDLGLADQLIASNDAGRVTWILRDNQLSAMPDGMRMMVPTDLAVLENSPFFTPEARAAYTCEPARAQELRASAPSQDESIASFVLRHYGLEVLNTVAAPLLAGVFGGDVRKLSVRAVMPRFVEMERQHGSLINALQSMTRREQPSIFTTLATGLQTLVDHMLDALPPGSIHTSTPVVAIHPEGSTWRIDLPGGRVDENVDHVILATPVHVTRALLPGLVPDRALYHLPTEASSAVLVALAFSTDFDLPAGFGFLVPHTEASQLLAATFVDQKFPGRVPPGHRLLRAFFGGSNGLALTSLDDKALAALALTELARILGPLPEPAFATVQRWPQSLPQYEVGHLERIAELMASTPPNLHLLGNAYRGVGLPDLIRDARALAHQLTN